ncbi:hypothetical protein [Anaeromyxobacter paludicola]|uniref:hypothetical protein n=1 Tax=Anaeromyxobacter paludicola TaxID=2918171 RepID=UPI0020C092EE|nr:hypothetical protein [Anaeromyxobacter paludicola]
MIWHLLVDGAPACAADWLPAEERLEFPLCGSRDRQRLEDWAAFLRARHAGQSFEVRPGGCDVRGE